MVETRAKVKKARTKVQEARAKLKAEIDAHEAMVKAEGQRRRKKVLTSKIVKKDLRTIGERNATESPLLALHPALRNRIFKSLLGNKTIHISIGLNGKVDHTICQEQVSDEEVARDLKALENPGVPHHVDFHEGCGRGRTRKIRQILQEAALIPYTHNTFRFDDDGTEDFLHVLLPAQAHAIHSIVLASPMVRFYQDFRPFAKMLENKLRGVKHLVAFKNLTAQFLKDEETGYHPDGFKPTNELLMLESLEIKKAVVAPQISPTYQRGLTKEAVEKWTTEMESRLLAPPDGLSYSQRHKKQ